MQFPFNSPEEKTGYLIYQVYLLWQRKVSQVIEDLDVTYRGEDSKLKDSS